MAVKRPPPTTKKVTPWKRYCDWVWALIIKLLAGYRCEICGCTGKQMYAHHLIDREVLVYRYDLMNGICLCYRCHTGDKHTAAHRSPIAFQGRVAYDERYFWWMEHYDTGPDSDKGGMNKLNPKLKDYPGIADGLEQKLEQLEAAA